MIDLLKESLDLHARAFKNLELLMQQLEPVPLLLQALTETHHDPAALAQAISRLKGQQRAVLPTPAALPDPGQDPG